MSKNHVTADALPKQVQFPNQCQFIDITGERYGGCVVLYYVGKQRWLCRSDGGEYFTQYGYTLRASRRVKRVQPERHVWCSMRKRCNNPNDKQYRDYGGRGISVCERWQQSFEAFLEDMGPRPSPDHQIDRIDNDGNYEPGNCRWATRKEQQRNTRKNRFVTYNGETRCYSEWAELYGLPRRSIGNRLSLGWTMERILNTPPRRY